ncbi:Ribonuclease P protein subunit p40 like [Verticillium longisporum]|uniref:Ribonuclease P protein subunit p40 like n=1 Tax=Verticillium longisporum TaxID=100787 RepID=A0A0G4MC07_VERLO|nr:Ribonuclease P protein subunit p40 like [Verticillium longisporum]KAG7108600.1 Ribonuclease P protein subunit p40 like [Verticillium longisporum]CRK31696.1 hypothetical protein BN1708_005508 [Verticillium longisporum]
MLSFAEPSLYQSPRCSVTYGTMAHVEPRQLPTKGKPWNSIMAQGFNHQVDLVVPEECYELVKRNLVEQRNAPVYQRVTMTLGQILDGAFFLEYMKKGNVLMLSEGRTTDDNMFSLREGLLTMYMDKETYERAGLVGKPYGVKGKRGLKPRWIVSYQLRDESMLHGKKGFDRLLYACRNVLKQPVTWLFANLGSTPSPDPMEQLATIKFTSRPGLVDGADVVAPALNVPSEVLSEGDRPGLEEFASETYEWLSLVRLESPRVAVGDDINSYLSRYQVPNDSETASRARICKITWRGLLTADWVRQLLIDVLATVPSRAWISFSATSFSKGIVNESAEISFLRPSDAAGHYLMWEIQGQEA